MQIICTIISLLSLLASVYALILIQIDSEHNRQILKIHLKWMKDQERINANNRVLLNIQRDKIKEMSGY